MQAETVSRYIKNTTLANRRNCFLFQIVHGNINYVIPPMLDHRLTFCTIIITASSFYPHAISIWNSLSCHHTLFLTIWWAILLLLYTCNIGCIFSLTYYATMLLVYYYYKQNIRNKKANIHTCTIHSNISMSATTCTVTTLTWLQFKKV